MSEGEDGLIEFEGKVIEILPGGQYKIEVLLNHKPNQTDIHMITAYSSGKIKRNKIKIVVGDKVKVETQPADLSKGRIMLRCK